MTVTALRPAEVDPLGPLSGGVWRGPGVRVRRRSGPPTERSGALHTPRFRAIRRDGTLTVEHDLTPDELSDTLAVLLTEQLDGILLGQQDFESVFTGVVRTTVPGGLAAWTRFYRNSLGLLESGRSSFAAVHQRAAELVTGPWLLDLGSCFGFFPLRMSRLGHEVTRLKIMFGLLKDPGIGDGPASDHDAIAARFEHGLGIFRSRDIAVTD